MEMQAGEAVVIGHEQSVESLTFDWLYRQVQRYAEHSVYPKASRVERWSFRVGLAAAGLGILSALIPASLLSVTWALAMAIVCLCIEVAGFLLGGILLARRELRQFTKPRLSHAREMDSTFAHWRGLVHRLRQFPRTEREERLRFVHTLRSNMIDRMGLMYGGLQRLGPFPLLIALYLQFRNVGDQGWMAVFDVSGLHALLIFMLVLMYAAGWLLVGLRA